MTSVFRARRRAEEFATVLDRRVEPRDAELSELAGVVTALRAHEAPTPRPEFAADLRARLLAEAETALSADTASLVLPTRPQGRRERRLVAAATVAVLVGGSAGMATAAQHALPGEALYPIKRGIEHAQAGLSASSEGKGRDLLQQAGDRLTEARGLLATQPATGLPQLPQTIDDFTTQAQEGAALLVAAFQENRDPATLTGLRQFAAQSLVTLQNLARTAPPDSQDDLAAAASALSAIDAQARDLCPSCATNLPDLDVPPVFLAAAEVRNALHNVDPSTLDNSHPVVVDKRAVTKPATGLTAAPSAAPSGSRTSTSPAPQPSASPSTGLSLPGLPGTDTPTTTSPDLGNTLNGTVTHLTDGLGGAVETLLPDPTSNPLP